jgi:adenine specific DNA methylase Mod
MCVQNENAELKKKVYADPEFIYVYNKTRDHSIAQFISP